VKAIVFFMFGGLVVGIVILILAARIANRKRLEALASLFHQLGDNYWPKPTEQQRAEAFSGIGSPQTLKHGAKKVKWAAQTHSQGPGTWIVEHSYTVSVGNHHQVVTHVVASAPIQSWTQEWVSLRVARQTLGGKLSVMMGGVDIRLDDPVFNKAFRVQAESEEFALLLLTPQVQQWLLAMPKAWALEAGSGVLRVLHRGSSDAEIVAQLIAAPRMILSMTTPELVQGEPRAESASSRG
jgi:hypothetical protein